MVKKLTSIRIEPGVIKKLKFLSVEYDRPLGEILEGLVKFSESGEYITDDRFKKLFHGLLETSIMNTGNRSGWAKPGESLKETTDRLVNEREKQFKEDIDGEKEI